MLFSKSPPPLSFSEMTLLSYNRQKSNEGNKMEKKEIETEERMEEIESDRN
jgi:hypothetical protein